MCAEQANRMTIRRVPKGTARTKWGTMGPQRHTPRAEARSDDSATLSHGEILGALRALLRGEPSVRLPDHLSGVDGQLAATFNQLAQLHMDLEEQFRLLRQTIGTEGKTRARLHLV